MPPPSARTSGPNSIWIIACVLFICVVAGGVCLAFYALLPETAPWVPVVGVSLVCLPWMFWITTFLYRILSRAFGCRLGGGGGGKVAAASANFSNPSGDKNAGVGSEGSDQDGDPNGLNGVLSVDSHDSETPLKTFTVS